MPIYVYRCQECGSIFERIQKMNDPKMEKCSKCGGKVERVPAPGVGLVFKGKGFYETDYKRASANTPCSRESPCCGRETRCEKPPCEN